MHALDFILTLAGGFAAALLCGYLTHRFGLSPIVGYLFAGIAIGPHTPGFVADRHLAEQLAEVGVILLMFGAFLAGMVVPRSRFSVRAASEALPTRDAFAVLFFVSVGMLLDPAQLLRTPGLILLATAVILTASRWQRW
jgi:predicted Kef-type K+ transport protein